MKCSDCKWRKYCLPSDLSGPSLSEFEHIVHLGKKFEKEQRIYSQGSSFRSLFAIQSGSVKTQYTLTSGYTQVTAFYYPGEVIGLDAIDTDKYPGTAIVLEDSIICEIPFAHLEQIAQQQPILNQSLFKLMGREYVRDQSLLFLLGSRAAEERVLSFLSGIAKRHTIMNPGSQQLQLSMSRTDIASFLGISLETVSRELTKLKKNGWLELSGRNVLIHQPANFKEYVFQLADKTI